MVEENVDNQQETQVDQHEETEIGNGESAGFKCQGDNHRHPEEYIKPGNRNYLSYYKYQGEWKPTKPKRQVGAVNSGPGPAIVNLPTTIGDQEHDPRRRKSPAYKIGERDISFYSNEDYSFAPGAATYDTRQLTNKGKDVCHAPKIGERIKGLDPFLTPGPAAYHRGKGDPIVYKKPPAYSMKFKHPLNKPFNSPAPDRYTLPQSLGSRNSPFGGGPQFSIGKRFSKTGIPQMNPGPAAYKMPSTNIHKQRAPAYSMGSRTMSQWTGTSTPGPASNELHLVKFHKPATPRFSFGVRHSPFQAFQSFAAGD